MVRSMENFPTHLRPRCYCLPQDLVDILNMTIPLLVQPAMETAGRRRKPGREKCKTRKQAKATLPRRNKITQPDAKSDPASYLPAGRQTLPTSHVMCLLKSRQEGLWIVFCRWFSDWLISENKLLWLPAPPSEVGMWTPSRRRL